MSGSNEEDTDVEGSTEANESEATAVSSTYKVLGEFAATDGVGVLGRNTASTGTPIGVKGAVPNSSDGYGLATPDDVKIEGTVHGDTDWSVEVQDGDDAGHVVHGHPDNRPGLYNVGATIGGGGGPASDEWHQAAGDYATVGGGKDNNANSDYDTVGGGLYNVALNYSSDFGGITIGGGENNEGGAKWSTIAGGRANEVQGQESAIAGGWKNTATGTRSSIGGGRENTVSARAATVPGGRENEASGNSSFAAGKYAVAKDDNAFVWNDGSGESDDAGSSDDRFSSSTGAGSSPTGSDTFHVKSKGGVRFITSGDNSNVTYISGNSAGWSNTSTRAAKTNVEPIDTEDVLDHVEQMDVSTWEYTDADGNPQGERHIGPMAEDFHDGFDFGDSDEHINSIDADGMLFAAVQGLSKKLDRKCARIDELEAELEQKDDRIVEIEARLEALEDREGTTRRPTADD